MKLPSVCVLLSAFFLMTSGVPEPWKSSASCCFGSCGACFWSQPSRVSGSSLSEKKALFLWVFGRLLWSPLGPFFRYSFTLSFQTWPARNYLPTSMLLPVAVLAGSVGGLYVYDVSGAQTGRTNRFDQFGAPRYAIYPQFYSNARQY